MSVFFATLFLPLKPATVTCTTTAKTNIPDVEKDIPWRLETGRPVPKIHLSPVPRVDRTPYANHDVSVMRCPNPIGDGVVIGAVVEPAGPDCFVPGLSSPVRLLDIKVDLFAILLECEGRFKIE